MKEKFDPNRPYNRDAINKAQKKRVRLMDEEALNRGRKLEGLPKITNKKEFDKELKLNPNHKVYNCAYTDEILRGGDAYEFEHIIPAVEVFRMLKSTHTDEEIAEIVNNPKNYRPVRKDINRSKGPKDFQTMLDDSETIERFGLNKKLSEKALKNARNSITSSLKKSSKSNVNNTSSPKFKKRLGLVPPLKPNTSGGSSSSSSKSSNSNNDSRSSSYTNSANAPKFPIKLILGIIVVIILLQMFFWLKDIFPFDKKGSQTNDVPKTEIISDKNNVSEKITLDEESTKTKLSFAKPLDYLTKSVTDISEFNSIVENQNTIPVIGSMFEYNSSTISNNGKEVLAGFANEYNKVEVPVKVLIEGFTCTIGSAKYNQILGEKRANNLKLQLIDLGVDENVIVIKPIGKQNFVSTNNGNNDLVLNRRSNVTIMSAE